MLVHIVRRKERVRLTRGVARNQFPLLTVDNYMLEAVPWSEFRIVSKDSHLNSLQEKNLQMNLLLLVRSETVRERFAHRCTMNVTMAVNATVNCSIHVSVCSITENIMLTPIPLHRPHVSGSQRRRRRTGRVKGYSHLGMKSTISGLP